MPEINPADYHEWEFRTELRIVAHEQQEKRRKKKSSFESSGGSEGDLPGRKGAPATGAGFIGSVPAAPQNPHESSSDDGSVETVLRVVEDLRGDACQKAKDIGIAALSAPRRLRTSGQRLCSEVGESIVSYMGRRRRWWTLMTQLDPRISLSGSLRGSCYWS